MLMVETVFSFALACEWRRTDAGKHILHFDSENNGLIVSGGQGMEFPVAIADSVEVALAKDLGGSIKEVRHVLVDTVNDAMLVWVIVDNPERDVREKIFQKELELMDAFPEINFDFNIVPALGRLVNDIVTEAKPVFSREG